MQNNNMNSFSRDIAGKKITIEINRFKTMADGCVTVQMGDTVVMANATMGRNADLERDFFPLNVDYEENFYASGKIKGSRFIKRKGRPSDEVILTSRLIDRSLRPLFPKGMRNPVQVIVSVLSFDKENDADILSLIAASTALSLSGIPFDGPIGAARIGLVNNQFVVNPAFSEREFSELDLIVSTAGDKVDMIEAQASEISEDKMNAGIEMARKIGMDTIDFINDITKKVNSESPIKKLDVSIVPDYNEEIAKKIVEKYCGEITEAMQNNSIKKGLEEALAVISEKVLEDLIPSDIDEAEEENQKKEITKAFDGAIKKIIRKNILEKDIRIGGRKIDEIRPLSSEVGVLPRTHGSGYFQRGETRALTIATLGSPSEAMIIDGMEEESTKRYMHFYAFPPYSTGETSPLRSPGRREIGHGALAEKALNPVIPSKEIFPYTILLQTEIISSSGSTSMASTCGSTLALMDAGVPIKHPVAGIAMGLMTNPENIDDFKVLTDIRDLEDFGGDMDFKIAGTKNGITAIQMDTKLHGIPNASISETLEKAKVARKQILEVIKKAISEPRKEISQYAPKIIVVNINPEKIGELIGPGGKTINSIIDETGAKIDIEEDGSVFITSAEPGAAEAAQKLVRNYTREIVPGEILEGKVVKILEFGAFIEITPKQSGLVHISEISQTRIARVEDVLHIGDIVRVKIKNIDDMGRINLTMKGLS